VLSPGVGSSEGVEVGFDGISFSFGFRTSGVSVLEQAIAVEPRETANAMVLRSWFEIFMCLNSKRK